MRRRRTGGRTLEVQSDYELIAYGETNDNGEFDFGFLPKGTYRFFVEYPGIPLDQASFVEFEVGEEGISDTDYKLTADITEEGIFLVDLLNITGNILDYFKNLRIYPNPVVDQLYIEYAHLNAENIVGQLVDLSGNVMWELGMEFGYDGNLTVDVSKYPEGVYILYLFDDNAKEQHVASFKVVVTN